MYITSWITITTFIRVDFNRHRILIFITCVLKETRNKYIVKKNYKNSLIVNDHYHLNRCTNKLSFSNKIDILRYCTYRTK